MQYSWFGFTLVTAAMSFSAQAAVCQVDTANRVVLDSRTVQVSNSSGQQANLAPGAC